MTKKLGGNIVLFFLINFLIFSTGCEMPWDKATSPTATTTTGGVNSPAKYAGTYKGTVRYNLNSYPEEIYPIIFTIDTNGNLTSMTINGQKIDVSDKNQPVIFSSSGFVTQDGKMVGQASAYDTTFGNYTFSYNGYIDASGNLLMDCTYKGGIYGTMAIIANRI